MYVARPTSCTYSAFTRNATTTIPRPFRKSTAPACNSWYYYSSQTWTSFRRQRRERLSQPSLNQRVLSEGGRGFSTSSTARHGHLAPPKPGEELKVTFIDKDGQESTFEVAEGDNLLDIAQSEDLEMEGACGGSCACSTCHVIVESNDLYDKMPEPDDDENDMLDLAFGLTETSRLGCQVKMTKELDGLRIRLPSMTRNLQASDFSGAKKA